MKLHQENKIILGIVILSVLFIPLPLAFAANTSRALPASVNARIQARSVQAKNLTPVQELVKKMKSMLADLKQVATVDPKTIRTTGFTLKASKDHGGRIALYFTHDECSVYTGRRCMSSPKSLLVEIDVLGKPSKSPKIQTLLINHTSFKGNPPFIIRKKIAPGDILNFRIAFPRVTLRDVKAVPANYPLRSGVGTVVLVDGRKAHIDLNKKIVTVTNAEGKVLENYYDVVVLSSFRSSTPQGLIEIGRFLVRGLSEGLVLYGKLSSRAFYYLEEYFRIYTECGPTSTTPCRELLESEGYRLMSEGEPASHLRLPDGWESSSYKLTIMGETLNTTDGKKYFTQNGEWWLRSFTEDRRFYIKNGEWWVHNLDRADVPVKEAPESINIEFKTLMLFYTPDGQLRPSDQIIPGFNVTLNSLTGLPEFEPISVSKP